MDVPFQRLKVPVKENYILPSMRMENRVLLKVKPRAREGEAPREAREALQGNEPRRVRGGGEAMSDRKDPSSQHWATGARCPRMPGDQ